MYKQHFTSFLVSFVTPQPPSLKKAEYRRGTVRARRARALSPRRRRACTPRPPRPARCRPGRRSSASPGRGNPVMESRRHCLEVQKCLKYVVRSSQASTCRKQIRYHGVPQGPAPLSAFGTNNLGDPGPPRLQDCPHGVAGAGSATARRQCPPLPAAQSAMFAVMRFGARPTRRISGTCSREAADQRIGLPGCPFALLDLASQAADPIREPGRRGMFSL